VNILNETGNYDGISLFYERWCTGDVSYEPSLKFYKKFLRYQPGPLLELGIGTGRIALEILQINSAEIMGVDVSRNMLAECRRKYDEQKKRNNIQGKLTLMNVKMENMDFHSEFQTVYLPFRTVGHLITDHLLERVFQRVYEALIPGGYFVLDHYMFSREWAENHNDIDILMYEKDDIQIFDHYHYDFERKLMECSIKKNGEIIQRFLFRWMEPATIRNSALRTGFQIRELYGEFDGSMWTEKSNNQIWILKK